MNELLKTKGQREGGKGPGNYGIAALMSESIQKKWRENELVKEASTLGRIKRAREGCPDPIFALIAFCSVKV